MKTSIVYSTNSTSSICFIGQDSVLYTPQARAQQLGRDVQGPLALPACDPTAAPPAGGPQHRAAPHWHARALARAACRKGPPPPGDGEPSLWRCVPTPHATMSSPLLARIRRAPHPDSCSPSPSPSRARTLPWFAFSPCAGSRPGLAVPQHLTLTCVCRRIVLLAMLHLGLHGTGGAQIGGDGGGGESVVHTASINQQSLWFLQRLELGW